MASVFEGKPSKQAIQEKLDRAFELYGVAKTEENYKRYGSVLVALGLPVLR